MAASDGSKLYRNKPKKSRLKQQASPSPMTSSTPPPMTPYTPPPAKPAPPSPPAKEPFLRRYRFLIPMLLAVNFSIGAYIYTRTKKKDTAIEMEETPPSPSVVTATESATIAEKLVTPPAVQQPVKEPISENDKREILKWMLEEKRKLKPRDPEEKKRIDEDKAILKQFIRAKSIPNL
ncbi:unnamed protein product [Cuscuta campestris]|uniref:Uncharacterized protein n=1 Tax=Cuscuta campestris TaxID=132261 RepID=A0A484KQN2_9ASTE|nr:unnamed protein product [Cuscuta campestris]